MLIWEQLRVLDSMVDNLGTLSRAQKRFLQDSPLSAFVQNELQQVMATTYDRLYPDLVAREFISIKGGVNPGAKSVAFDRWEGAGKAEWISSIGDDIPLVGVGKERESHPVHMASLGYGYSIQELMSAMFANTPLETKKAMAVARGIAEKEHETLLLGSSELNIPGLLTNKAIPRVIIANWPWTSTTTAAQMRDGLNQIFRTAYVGTDRVHKPDQIWLPLDQYMLCAEKQNSNASDKTVMQAFVEAHPFVNQIRPLTELATHPAVGNVPAMMAVETGPMNFEGVVPMPFNQLPPQIKGLRTMVPTIASFGGTHVYRPSALTIGFAG